MTLTEGDTSSSDAVRTAGGSFSVPCGSYALVSYYPERARGDKRYIVPMDFQAYHPLL
jgi:hypothetical protein